MYGFEIEPLEQEHQAMRSDPYEGTPLSALNIPEKYNFNVVTKQRKSTDELFVPSNAYDIVREGHYENDDGENSGTGYFPEGNVYIDLDGGEILTAVQCNECYEESQDPHSYLPIKKEGE